MPPIAELIQQGSSNLWLFIPTAILIGALHGLEPGHSKTMMASFIIAIRGTMAQAALLGLCAALSHSVLVWILAAAALHFGNELIAERAEPYFMLVSALIVIGVAVWMFLRTYWDIRAARQFAHAPHGGKIINTGHGVVELEIFEGGESPVFRVHPYSHTMRAQNADTDMHLELQVVRPGGQTESHLLTHCGAFWESAEEVAEPHQFEAVLTMGHGDHVHRYEVTFSETDHEHPHPPEHGHSHAHAHAHDHAHHHHDHAAHAASGEYQDAHERAHAQDIERRFAGRSVTTTQIALFGLTGGLAPCPASVTILVICLQLKKLALGAVMVASFSAGLAISLMSVGVLAAWGARHAGQRLGNFSALARHMPYVSSALMLVAGGVMAAQATLHLMAP